MTYDSEHGLVVAVVPGARMIETAEAIIVEAKQQLGSHLANLITSGELPAYETAVEIYFSEAVPPAERKGPGRPRMLPERQWSNGLNYATIHKNRKDHRVVSVEQEQISGPPEGLEKGLGPIDREWPSQHIIPGAS